jgi:thiol-disulfide isomerase/thioredoxin
MRSKYIVISVVFVATSVLLAWQAEQPATKPGASDVLTAAHEELMAPTTQPKISPQAQVVLDQINKAYGTSANLDLSGSVAVDMDAAGEKQNKSTSFTASYHAPNQFRHDNKDQILLGSNGQKAYIFTPGNKEYINVDVPALGQNVRLELTDLPAVFAGLIQKQNPAMLMALSKQPVDTLIGGVDAVTKDDDVTLDGTSYSTLKIVGDAVDVRVLVDQKSGLVRKIVMDISAMLKKEGTPAVNKALVTYDYTPSPALATATPVQYAWVPPQDGKELKPSAGADSDEENPSAKLIGQPAPAFALKDMDGKPISLASLKGKVVVLDFWATWCGPCREGLPHIEALAKQHAADPVRVFAINREEKEDVVKAFITETKLSLPVLLDGDGATAHAYLVNGIPATIIIGKDGKVAASFVGYGPDDHRAEDAVLAALK